MSHTSEGLVPAIAAAALVGTFQLLVTWFIFGHEDVLLQQLPLTVAAIASAQSFSLLRMPADGSVDLRSVRIVGVAALATLVAFCFVAAVATSRGASPIGDPPDWTEWAITLSIVLTVFFTDGYARRRVA